MDSKHVQAMTLSARLESLRLYQRLIFIQRYKSSKTSDFDAFGNLQKFALFTKLAPELRIKVWEFAIYVPQTVNILQGKSKTRFVAASKIPAVLHINRESRYEALKAYKIMLGPKNGGNTRNVLHSTPVYFNAEIDTIHLEHKCHVCDEGNDPFGIRGFYPSCKLPHPIDNLAQVVNVNISSRRDPRYLDFGGIQHLSLKFRWWNRRQWKMLLNNLYWAKSLKSVTIHLAKNYISIWKYMFREHQYYINIQLTLSQSGDLLPEEASLLQCAYRTLDGVDNLNAETAPAFIELVLKTELMLYAGLQRLTWKEETFIGTELIDFQWNGWWKDMVKLSAKRRLSIGEEDFEAAIDRMLEMSVKIIMY